MNNLLLLGGAGALLYFLRSQQEAKQKAETQKQSYLSDWHNPDQRIELVGLEYRINSVRISVDFSIFFPSKFKNNRLAGEIYFQNKFVKNIREAKNWKVKGNNYNAINYDFIIGAELWNMFPNIEYLVQTVDFWRNIRIKGNFESRDGDRIYFDDFLKIPTKILTQYNWK